MAFAVFNGSKVTGIVALRIESVTGALRAALTPPVRAARRRPRRADPFGKLVDTVYTVRRAALFR